MTGPDSVMVRASASEAGGRGFESGPRHTKDVKNGTSGYLAWRSAFIRLALASLLQYSKYVKVMVGGGQCSSVIVVILTLLGDDRGAPSGWRIIHSNNNNDVSFVSALAISIKHYLPLCLE